MPSLCEFTTADGQPLHGLLFSPDRSSDERAILLVHGVGGTFYTHPYPQLAEALAGHGFTVLATNTRGHDWVTRGPDGAPSAGASFEVISDCLLDLDAGLACLAEAGFGRFVVMGHSLGAVKAIYYQGHRRRSEVAAVVACSAPKLFYSQRIQEQPDFAKNMARAQAMLAEGRGSDLFAATAGSGPGLFSARTYVDKYGPEEHTDLRRLAPSLGCPVLTIAGSAEFTPSFVPYAQELAQLAKGTCEILDGAPHSYEGHESQIAALVADWLKRTEPAARKRNESFFGVASPPR
jgi:pimeloyl-ACP methyl ester carboxylesterase